GLFFGRLIKAAVSRQREFLADASSVQFTRNPEGIAGALATISAGPGSSLVANRRAETLSHMFFATGVSMWFESLFATHPPVLENLPAAVNEAVADAEGAGALVLALALSDDELARKQQLALLEAAGADALARRADALAGQTRGLAVQARLPVVALAGPSLRSLDAAARETLARQLQMLVEADHRITLEESVLLTL